MQSFGNRRKREKLLHGLSVQPITACSAGRFTPELREQAQEIAASGWTSHADRSLTLTFPAPSPEALL